MSGPPILFVSGFHRSGTTLLAAAATEAVGGVTTTAGVLARHLPALRDFLGSVTGPADDPDGAAAPVDRGVDRLPVTAATTEEYGFLLRHRTGSPALYGRPGGTAALRDHIAELAAEAPGRPVVLKNPYDVGQEARILADFPAATILLLRRSLAEVEQSIARALRRVVAAGPGGYPEALHGGGDAGHRRLARILDSPWRRAALRTGTRWRLSRGAFRLGWQAPRLPPDRVAFLCHDELLAGPAEAARRAAHLVDPVALAAAYQRLAFPERVRPAPAGPLLTLADRWWSAGWRRARAVSDGRAGPGG